MNEFIKKTRDDENAMWEEFRNKIIYLIVYYDCSFPELSDGLSIKTQDLKDFVYEKPNKKRIIISRDSIYHLWEYLTNYEIYKHYKSSRIKIEKILKHASISIDLEKNISKKDLRIKLKNKGPELLLSTLKLAPVDSHPFWIKNESRKRKLFNLLDILDSDLLNEERFHSLIHLFEENVVDSYELNQHSNKMRKDSVIAWIDKHLEHSKLSEYYQINIKKKIYKILDSNDFIDKKTYDKSEVQLLYSCVKSNILYRPNIYQNCNSGVKIKRVLFMPLSLDISSELKDMIEKSLLSYDEELSYLKIRLYSEILQIEINAEFEIDSKRIDNIYLNYASTATYLGNLNALIIRGLGGILHVPMSRFRTRAMSNSLEGLVECKSAVWKSIENELYDDDHSDISQTIYGNNSNLKCFWGHFVGNDTLLTTAQSITIAVEDCVHDSIMNNIFKSGKKLNISQELWHYYDQVFKISSLKKELNVLVLYDRQFLSIDIDCIDKLMNLTMQIFESQIEYIEVYPELEKIYQYFQIGLCRVYCLLQLQKARILVLNGNMSAAQLIFSSKNPMCSLIEIFKNKVSDKIKNGHLKSIREYINNNLQPLLWLYKAESIMFSLLTLKSNIYTDINLTRTLEDVCKKEQFDKYLNAIPSNHMDCNYYPYAGKDVYLGISELLGRMGQLRYYLAINDDSEVYSKLQEFGFTLDSSRNQLDEAEKFLLVASGYASKLGLKQRMAHWLLVCSRIKARKGEFCDAFKLREEAKTYLHDPKLSKDDLVQHIYMTELYLSEGESRYFQGRYKSSGVRLIQALQCAVYLGMNLRLADSLYVLGQTASKLSNCNVTVDSVIRRVPNFKRNLDILKSHIMESNADTQNIKKISLSCLIDICERSDMNWQNHSVKLINSSRYIWDYWASLNQNNNVEHVLSSLISHQEYKFISRVI